MRLLCLCLLCAALLAGCGRPDPDRQAEQHLRLAARGYGMMVAGAPQAAAAMRHLEAAAQLSRKPRYLFALAVARYETDRVRAMMASGATPAPPAPGAAGEPEFRELARHDPKNANACFYLGTIAMDRKDPGAERSLVRAAAADPANALPLYLAAAVRAQAGDAAGACGRVRQGNARSACHLYPSPALELAGGRPIGYTDPFGITLASRVRDVARVVAWPPRSRGGPPSPPSYAQKLLAQGRPRDALEASEAIWQMGKKLSAMEPLALIHGLYGGAIRSIALTGLEAGYQALRDVRGLALVGQRRSAEAQLRQFARARMASVGNPMAWMAKEMLRHSVLPGLPALLALLTGVGALGLRRRAPRVALFLGLGACGWVGLTIFLWAGGYMPPPGLFSDSETQTMRQYVRMIP